MANGMTICWLVCKEKAVPNFIVHFEKCTLFSCVLFVDHCNTTTMNYNWINKLL